VPPPPDSSNDAIPLSTSDIEPASLRSIAIAISEMPRENRDTVPAPDRAPDSSSVPPSELHQAPEALEVVERIFADIGDCEHVLACLTPERQRLWLLIWICRARAEQEKHPRATEVARAVARVARRLADLARAFWPGSVRALQLNASPADVGLGRRQGEVRPRLWSEAADSADRALEDHLAQAEWVGLDEDGWADAAQLDPRPQNSAALLEQVAAELEALASHTTNGAALDDRAVERMTHLGRMLRWMRGGVAEPVRWGTAMGRLRQIGYTLGERGEPIREVCDPRHRPRRPWAWAATLDAPRVPEPTPPIDDPPAPGADPAALGVWLVKAFALDTPALVARLAPRKEEFCALEETALPSPDRRLRRRFRELVRRLNAYDPNAVDGAPGSEPPDRRVGDGTSAGALGLARVVVDSVPPSEDEPQPPSSLQTLQTLCAAVRPRTEGRRALFVSNRHDPPLQTKLEGLLGLSVTWCEGSPRRVQAQCERIAHGAFDLVLSATGFQDHAADGVLARAARAASVPLVRVDRGRPLACVRAIARELGIGQESSAPASQG
jgi:hypothetical protein